MPGQSTLFTRRGSSDVILFTLCLTMVDLLSCHAVKPPGYFGQPCTCTSSNDNADCSIEECSRNSDCMTYCDKKSCDCFCKRRPDRLPLLSSCDNASQCSKCTNPKCERSCTALPPLPGNRCDCLCPPGTAQAGENCQTAEDCLCSSSCKATCTPKHPVNNKVCTCECPDCLPGQSTSEVTLPTTQAPKSRASEELKLRTNNDVVGESDSVVQSRATCDYATAFQSIRLCERICKCPGGQCVKEAYRRFKCHKQSQPCSKIEYSDLATCESDNQDCQDCKCHKIMKPTEKYKCAERCHIGFIWNTNYVLEKCSDKCNCKFEDNYARCIGPSESQICDRPCPEPNSLFSTMAECELECNCQTGKCVSRNEKFTCEYDCPQLEFNSLETCKQGCPCPGHTCIPHREYGNRKFRCRRQLNCSSPDDVFDTKGKCEESCKCDHGTCLATTHGFTCQQRCPEGKYKSEAVCQDSCTCPGHSCSEKYFVDRLNNLPFAWSCLRSCRWAGRYSSLDECTQYCECISGTCNKIGDHFRCVELPKICDQNKVYYFVQGDRKALGDCIDDCSTCHNHSCERIGDTYRCTHDTQLRPYYELDYKCDYTGTFDTMIECGKNCLCPFSRCIRDMDIFNGDVRGLPKKTIAYKCALTKCKPGYKSNNEKECNNNCLCNPSRGCTSVASGGYECHKCQVGSIYSNANGCVNKCKNCGFVSTCERHGERYFCNSCEAQDGIKHPNLQECYIRCTCGACMKDGLCHVGKQPDKMFVAQDPFRARF